MPVELTTARLTEILSPVAGQRRLYIAHRYTAPTMAEKLANVRSSTALMVECVKRGHLVHNPLQHTYVLDGLPPNEFDYFMALDLGILRRWATSLLWIPEFCNGSRGAELELKVCENYGLEVFWSLDDVPTLRLGKPGPDSSPPGEQDEV